MYIYIYIYICIYNNSSLAYNRFSVAAWPIENAEAAHFCHFRICQTDLNSSNEHHLMNTGMTVRNDSVWQAGCGGADVSMACFRRGGAASTWIAPHLFTQRSLRGHVCALACSCSICAALHSFALHSCALEFGCEVPGLDRGEDKQFCMRFLCSPARF